MSCGTTNDGPPAEPVRIRELAASDLSAVSSLLDGAIGKGFWDAEDLQADIALVTLEGGAVIGVGTAALEHQTAGPVGHIRLIAVDADRRRRAVATALLAELIGRCEARGATSLLAYAWVHGPGGTAPLAGVLTRAGFSLSRRIDGFYSGVQGAQCPACGESPCVCPADEYVREAGGTGERLGNLSTPIPQPPVEGRTQAS